MDAKLKLAARAAALMLAAGLSVGSAGLMLTAQAMPQVKAAANALTLSKISVQLSPSGEASMTVVLPQPQRMRLMELVYDMAAAEQKTQLDKGGNMTVALKANLMQALPSEDESLLKARLGVSSLPMAKGSLALSSKVADGQEAAIKKLSEPVEVTIELPAQLKTGGLCNVLLISDGKLTEQQDMDSIPNTVTFETADFGSFVLVAGELPTPPKQELKEEPKPEPKEEQLSEVENTQENPKAGGIPVDYLPRSVRRQSGAAYVLPTAERRAAQPQKTNTANSMAGVSIMLTAAFTCGWIDYENAPRQDEEEETIAE